MGKTVQDLETEPSVEFVHNCQVRLSQY